jgi:hypothetical protein
MRHYNGSKARTLRTLRRHTSPRPRGVLRALVLSGLALILAGFGVSAYRPGNHLGYAPVKGEAAGASSLTNRDSREIGKLPISPSAAAMNGAETPARASGERGPTPSRPDPLPGRSNPKLTNVAHIAITPRGFEAKVIELPPGPFFLLVENRSGVGGVSLRVDRMDTGRPVTIRQKDVSGEELDWADFFDLAPGTYLLSEAAHPDWQCRITVNH